MGLTRTVLSPEDYLKYMAVYKPHFKYTLKLEISSNCKQTYLKHISFFPNK